MRSYTIPSIFTAIDRFSAPVQKMTGAMDRFVSRSANGLARAERGFRSLISPITSLNKALAGLGLYIGLFTAVSLFRGAVSTIAEFEQAQVNIAVVTGKTIQQNKAMATQARALSLTYGEAAKSILDMDLALIKLFGDNSEGKVQRMAESVLTASIALKGVPEEVGKTMGAVMMAFKIPDSQKNVQMIGDLLAKAADLSALDWSDLQTMLPIAMQSAAIAWKDLAPMDQFKRLLALFAALRDAQVHVATGATGVKNLLIDSGIYFGQTSDAYVKMLEKISKDPDKMLQVTKKLLGRRTLVSALPLAEANKLGSIEDFVKKLDAATGYSERVAGQRMNSIIGKFEQAKRAYDEFIFSVDDGTGPLSASIKLYLDTAKAFLLINAGSEIARNELAKMDSKTIELAKDWGFWFRIIKYVVIALIILKAVIIAWRIVTIVAAIVSGIFAIALGLMAAAGWTSVFALRGSAMAMGTYRVATILAAASTWAMLGPILLAVAAIGLLTMGFLGFKDAVKQNPGMPDLIPKKPEPGQENLPPNAKMGFFNSPMGQMPFTYDANKFQQRDANHEDIMRKSKRNSMMDSLMMKMGGDSLSYKNGLDLNIPDEYKNVLNNDMLKSEISSSSLEKSMQELIIKVEAQQGTDAKVTKKPQGIPVTYSSTNGQWSK